LNKDEFPGTVDSCKCSVSVGIRTNYEKAMRKLKEEKKNWGEYQCRR
jgi:hypothetical protein